MSSLQWALRILTLAVLGAAAGDSVSAAENHLCGLHCLYVGLSVLGEEVSLEGLRDELGEPDRDGYVLGRLAVAAEDRGLVARPMNTDLAWLKARRGPFACVAHVRGSHFVLVTQIDDDGTVTVVDPPDRYTMPAATFREIFDGDVLLLAREERALEERPASWWSVVLPAALAAAVVGLLAAAALRWRAGRAG